MKNSEVLAAPESQDQNFFKFAGPITHPATETTRKTSVVGRAGKRRLRKSYAHELEHHLGS